MRKLKDAEPDIQRVITKSLTLRLCEWTYILRHLDQWEYLRDKIATQIIK